MKSIIIALVTTILITVAVTFADTTGKSLFSIPDSIPGKAFVDAFTGEGPTIVSMGTKRSVTINTGLDARGNATNIMAIKVECFPTPSGPFPVAGAVTTPFIYYVNGASTNYMIHDSGYYIQPLAASITSFTFRNLSSATPTSCSYDLHQNPNK